MARELSSFRNSAHNLDRKKQEDLINQFVQSKRIHSDNLQLENKLIIEIECQNIIIHQVTMRWKIIQRLLSSSQKQLKPKTWYIKTL
jgi:hypothetical protein